MIPHLLVRQQRCNHHTRKRGDPHPHHWQRMQQRWSTVVTLSVNAISNHNRRWLIMIRLLVLFLPLQAEDRFAIHHGRLSTIMSFGVAALVVLVSAVSVSGSVTATATAAFSQKGHANAMVGRRNSLYEDKTTSGSGYQRQQRTRLVPTVPRLLRYSHWHHEPTDDLLIHDEKKQLQVQQDPAALATVAAASFLPSLPLKNHFRKRRRILFRLRRRMLLQMRLQQQSPPRSNPNTNQTSKNKHKKNDMIVVSTVEQLQYQVLTQQLPLKQIKVQFENSTSASGVVSPASSSSSSSPLPAPAPVPLSQQHAVIQLMVQRFHDQQQTQKGHHHNHHRHQRRHDRRRHHHHNDNATLALALEGGGMRGAVPAGMAAALCVLGLVDTIDVVYGSSAGSVIGAYLVSRQMCVDVYADLLTKAQKTFVCSHRIFQSLVHNAVSLYRLAHKNNNKLFSSSIISSPAPTPGMNISFVLDSILDAAHGLRPLDVNQFRINNQYQPLRIVASSAVKEDDNDDNEHLQLETRCFGTHDYFSPSQSASTSTSTSTSTTSTTAANTISTVAHRVDQTRHGLFACLEASMTVPGATGPPIDMRVRHSQQRGVFFDAFCFEPIPYRSAVYYPQENDDQDNERDDKNGDKAGEVGAASHVLVLCSRPDGYTPVTQPGLYERIVAPLYFRAHQLETMARFFQTGGQQFIYAEDLLVLHQGKNQVQHNAQVPVKVPPPQLRYGVTMKNVNVNHNHTTTMKTMTKQAHLLPIQVPAGTPELATLEQDRDIVLEAMRSGFAVTYDLFVPFLGIHQDDALLHNFSGRQVAELLFPNPNLNLNSNSNTNDQNQGNHTHKEQEQVTRRLLLSTQIRVPGDAIVQSRSHPRTIPYPRTRTLQQQRRRRLVIRNAQWLYRLPWGRQRRHPKKNQQSHRSRRSSGNHRHRYRWMRRLLYQVAVAARFRDHPSRASYRHSSSSSSSGQEQGRSFLRSPMTRTTMTKAILASLDGSGGIATGSRNPRLHYSATTTAPVTLTPTEESNANASPPAVVSQAQQQKQRRLLLASLPGLQNGRLAHLARHLHPQSQTQPQPQTQPQVPTVPPSTSPTLPPPHRILSNAHSSW